MNKTETPTPVVLILTRRQAEALASLITRSQMHDRWVDSVRTQLPRSLAELHYQRSSAAGSAFAAARAVVDQARLDIMAEPAATNVARAAGSTPKSVVRAALTTAGAAQRERHRKAEAAQTAPQELAHTAVRTATSNEEGAYATAERVSSDAAQAAEIVAAAIASGGDAETALAALQATATPTRPRLRLLRKPRWRQLRDATAVTTAAAQAALAARTAAAGAEEEVVNDAAAIRLIATK